MRCIDHLVIAVHDLDQAGELYRRLGFQVGARNRHPWGTENRLVQFRSSFLELIVVGDDAGAVLPHAERRFSFGAFLSDYLARRSGLAMLVLDSDDAAADAAAFARAGLGDFEPFFFERRGRRPDGGETHVAFTLAFARDEGLPEAGFFVCQQHLPENFWNAGFQVHPNGAADVAAVELRVANPSAHAAFLSGFTGAAAQRRGAGYLAFVLNGGRLVVTRLADSAASPLASFTVAIGDIDRQAAALSAAGVPFAAAAKGLRVPAEAAFGVEIVFETGGVKQQSATQGRARRPAPGFPLPRQ